MTCAICGAGFSGNPKRLYCGKACYGKSKVGVPLPAAAKEKLRLAKLARNPMKGRKHTHETRAKMRAAENKSWARGEGAVGWKGGRVTERHGYILIYAPDHPNAVGLYVLEHRLVMERALGRLLLAHEHVHHKNEIRTDNRIENLELTSNPDHMRRHRLQEIAEGFGTTFSRARR
jgi:hypothetical protein